MKSVSDAGIFGRWLSIVVLCYGVGANAAVPTLPCEQPINPEAGRGGGLVAMVRFDNDQEYPFVVDTGTSCTFLDKSLEPKLGKALGTVEFQSWGVKRTVSAYAPPKLYLGGAQLKLSESGVLTDNCQEWGSVEGRPIMGMLGIDCLGQYCIQLDFAAGKMRFLDAQQADKSQWGKAFPIVPLNDNDGRPAIGLNLFGIQGPHSLIDSGCAADGWLMPQYHQQWTNHGILPARGEARWPHGMFGGEKYPFVALLRKDVESDGIGLRFLARHLVTLDFPNHMMYLQRQMILPRPDPNRKTTRAKSLEPLVTEILREDVDSARKALGQVERISATDLEKAVARKLVAALENQPKLSPAEVPSEVVEMPLGDARPELSEVGWLKPAGNRIPLNEDMPSPLLDCGQIYATGFYAHSPSRYVFNLGGKWRILRGEAGLHTAFQPDAFGVVYVIKTDGKEAFRSPVVRGANRVHYEIEVMGVKTLELLVESAYERNGCNWSLWLEPTLSRKASGADGSQ